MDESANKTLQREILLGFWKIHILFHAGEGPLVGQWMLRELRRHGYDISPGTLYPMLHRMDEHGWLRCEIDPTGGSRAKRSYYLTEKGERILSFVRNYVRELWEEIENDHESKCD